MWVCAPSYSHRIWAENCDVLGQSGLCSRATTTITPEMLEALSQEAFTSIRELVEVEDLRRLTATPVSYPTPGQYIRTPEQTVQRAHEGRMSTRYESLIALCLSQTHEALALYHVYYGQSCPLPAGLDIDPLIHAAQACQTNRLILVRYHTHPFVSPMVEDAQEIRRLRLTLTDAGTPMYDFLITGRTGDIFSVRGWGQPSRTPAGVGGVASNA